MNFDYKRWDNDNVNELIKYLKSIANERHRDFSLTITPTNMQLLGVSFPELNVIAKSISKGNYREFLEIKINNIFELEILKGYVIANIKDVTEYRDYFERFIKTIDNWAVCDTFLAMSKVIEKDRTYYFSRCKELIKEDNEFLNRVGFVVLLDYFIDDEHIDELYDMINGYNTEKYYSMMALGWLISYIFIKYPDRTFEYMKTCTISKDILKIAVSKIRDSRRVDDKYKNKLKKEISFCD